MILSGLDEVDHETFLDGEPKVFVIALADAVVEHLLHQVLGLTEIFGLISLV